MAPDDSTPGRRFTVGDTEPAESAFGVLHHTSSRRIGDEELAGALLALVEQCSEISVPVSNVCIVVTEDRVNIEVPRKTLRVLLCCDKPTEVTWREVQRRAPQLPPNHEWIVVSTRSMTAKAKQWIKELQGGSAMHYIELSGSVREAEDTDSAGNSVGDNSPPRNCFSRVENYWIRKLVLTASERTLRRN